MTGADWSKQRNSVSGAVNAKEGMDEYALWPCKFNGYKLKNLTQVGAAANTSLG